MQPHRWQPTRLHCPEILQARTLEWIAISFSNAGKWKVKVKLLSGVWPSATPWTAAFQAPPSMRFFRQEYWSGLPLSSLLAALLHGKYMGGKWKQRQIFFSWAPKSLWTMTAAVKLKDTCSLEEKLWQHIKKQRHHFIRGPYSQRYGFSSSHIQMWEL